MSRDSRITEALFLGRGYIHFGIAETGKTRLEMEVGGRQVSNESVGGRDADRLGPYGLRKDLFFTQ